MLNTLTFGGLVSSSYGVYISGSGTFSAPERDYQFQAVPGRNGELALDNKRYLDIDVVYPAFIKNNFDSNLANLRSAFSAKIGYQELSDSYHPNEFRLAVFSKGLDVKPIKNLSAGQFDLSFRCKPQRFLTSGKTKTTITSSTGSINNPTSFESKPLITVTGYGTLTIGTQTITITNHFTDVTIDSELGDCYKGSNNANLYVSFSGNKFPVLVPGTNAISRSGNITKVEITPRWFEL